MSNYLTKIAYGRHWWYVDTKRKYRYERKVLGRWFMLISYRKVPE